MSDKSETIGPDLTLGVAIDSIPDGKMLLGHVGEDAVVLARRGSAFFAIGATRKGSSSATRSDVRGTTPVSTCGRGKRCVRRRSVLSRAGRPSRAMARCSCATKWRRRRGQVSQLPQDHRRRS